MTIIISMKPSLLETTCLTYVITKPKAIDLCQGETVGILH